MAEVTLRYYQKAAYDGAVAAYRNKAKGALVVHATGTGKTYVGAAFAHYLAQENKRTLILAAQGELLNQMANSLDAYGLRYEVEKSEEKARVGAMFTDVVLASVQTLRSGRLEKWPKDYFEAIICDEAHIFMAPTFRRSVEHFNAFRLGLTATPERGDGKNLGAIFSVLAHEYPLALAINEGNLCRLNVERPTTSVDLSRITTTGGDLNKGDLEDEIGRHVEQLVNATRERIGERTAIVFTPDVGSAEAFADGLRKVGIEARSVHGGSEDRAVVIQQFKDKEFQVLCNCQLLTTGVDVPHVGAIVLARPTKSGVLIRQMIGRGTRNYPGKKDCLILDFAWISGNHKTASTIDLFDTSETDERVKEVAAGLVNRGRQKDPMKAIEQAERIIKYRDAHTVNVKQKESGLKFVAYDPFCVSAMLGVKTRGETKGNGWLPDHIINRMRGYQIPTAGMSRSHADRLLAELDSRRKAGLASHRQVALLISKGIDKDTAMGLTFEEASFYIDIS